MKIKLKIFKWPFVVFSFMTLIPQVQAASSSQDENLEMVTLEQLGKMDHFSRIQYILLLRETLIDLEKTQNSFHFEVAHFFPPSDRKELIATFFGHEVFTDSSYANAADNKKHDSQDLFYRNLNKEIANEGCIYAGHYRHYSQGKSDYGCERPPCSPQIQKNWTTTYQRPQFSTAFVECSFSSFGIEMCVQPGIESTSLCAKKALQLEQENKTKVDDFLKKNVTQEWLNKKIDERLKLANDLKNMAYDPRAMAHLAKLAADYQKTPQANLSSIPALTAFANFDVKTQGIKALFQSITQHCHKKLDEHTALKSVENEKGPWAQRRKNYLKEVREHNKPPRVGNVLQRDECEALIGKYDVDKDKFAGGRFQRLQKAYDNIAKQCTPLASPKPPPASPPPASTPQAPAPIDPNKLVNTVFTGCRPTHELLFDRGMQCAKCVAEKYYSDTNSNSYYASGVSEKWLSLLSTMIYQCPRVWSQPPPSPKQMAKLALEYSQTFGHCSVNDYDWGTLTDKQVSLVKQWQNTSRTPLTPTSPPLRDGQAPPDVFGEIYGIDVKTANELFCSPLEKASGAKDYSSLNSSTYRGMAQRRYSMLEFYNKKLKNSVEASPHGSNSARSGILKCLESIDQQEKKGLLYNSENNGERCLSYVPSSPQAMQRAIQSALQEQPVVAIDQNGFCYVSHTTLQYQNGRIEMRFASPRVQLPTRPAYESKEPSSGVAYQSSRTTDASWIHDPKTQIVSISSNETTPGRSYCPDTRGRTGYRVPSAPLPPQPPPSSKEPSPGFNDRGDKSTQ